jgi:SAM-dependent methyltransferase
MKPYRQSLSPTTSDNAFSKYREKGAYHWRLAYSRGLLRAHPGVRALYGLPLRVISQLVTAESPRGADIGCGDGVLVYEAMSRGLQIIGIDLSMDGLELAHRELGAHGFRSPLLLNADCRAVSLQSCSLDYVVSVEVIEHLEHPMQFLAEVARVLKPGGTFVCTTPCRDSGDSALRDPFHVREFSSEELGDLLAVHFDFCVVKGVFPAWLDGIYKGVTGLKWIDRGMRVAIRMLSALVNPYSAVVCDDPEASSCRTLVGIAQIGKKNDRA